MPITCLEPVIRRSILKMVDNMVDESEQFRQPSLSEMALYQSATREFVFFYTFRGSQA